MGLFSNVQLKEKWVPFACAGAALVTWVLNGLFISAFKFDFGFMNILVNALLTIVFLLVIKKKSDVIA